MNIEPLLAWKHLIPSRRQVAKTLELAGEVAPVLALVSRSRIGAYVSVGLKVADVAFKLYDHATCAHGNAWEHFVHAEGEWTGVPHILRAFVVQRARNARRMRHDEDGNAAFEAALGCVGIGWVAKGDNQANIKSVYVRTADVAKLERTVGEDIWATCGSRHLVRGETSLEADLDPASTAETIDTNFITTLRERVRTFLPHGPRSYLVHGPPGTGKTTCIRRVVRELGLRSLRVPLAQLINKTGNPKGDGHTEEDELGIAPTVQILRPRVIVIDDLDRAPKWIQNQLLDLMEMMRAHADVILVSANETDNLDGALKRVKRLDDHIRVPPLDRATIEALLGDEREIVDRMAGWPIGFIQDYAHRVRVIGRAAARAEIDGLEQRVRAQAPK